MKEILKKYGWTIFNLYIFASITVWCVWNAWNIWRSGKMTYVEGAFIAQNFVFAGVILLRTKHLQIHKDILHQVVALIAFWSGMLFMGQPPTGGPKLLAVSNVIAVTANVLGIATLLNLGRSFGILIACRTIKTKGLYGVIRHPMYGTDILMRVAFLVGHFNLYTAGLFALSSGCYVWRALLEEKFLSAAAPEYARYMAQVRWRFIPGVF